MVDVVSDSLLIRVVNLNIIYSLSFIYILMKLSTVVPSLIIASSMILAWSSCQKTLEKTRKKEEEILVALWLQNWWFRDVGEYTVYYTTNCCKEEFSFSTIDSTARWLEKTLYIDKRTDGYLDVINVTVDGSEIARYCDQQDFENHLTTIQDELEW